MYFSQLINYNVELVKKLCKLIFMFKKNIYICVYY